MSMNCSGCEHDGFVMLGGKKASYCKYFKKTKQNMDRTISLSYYPFQHGYCLYKTNDEDNYNNCLGCKHFDEEHTNRICYDCKRAYRDR